MIMTVTVLLLLAIMLTSVIIVKMTSWNFMLEELFYNLFSTLLYFCYYKHYI